MPIPSVFGVCQANMADRYLECAYEGLKDEKLGLVTSAGKLRERHRFTGKPEVIAQANLLVGEN
jgi:hypothetical protein